jgi:hypothetical protein
VLFQVQEMTANVELVASKGLPLPTLASYDLISTNTGTNDEWILCFTNSTPVRLSPGDWFLSVVNPSGISAAYSVTATEVPFNWGQMVIFEWHYTNDSFCLSWTAVPGSHYFVQGTDQVPSTNWTTISADITATNLTTPYCIPLPSEMRYFRIEQHPEPAEASLR